MNQNLKRTPLYNLHQKLGARFVEFSGWQMPVQYSGVNEEHLTVRSAVGLFDVSHMGQFWVEGGSALEELQYLLSNDLSKIGVGRAQYSFVLNERGGVVDDIITYHIAPERYLLCVNAGSTVRAEEWISSRLRRALFRNVSSELSLIAVQGPKAESVLSRLLGTELTKANFKNFSVGEFEFTKAKLILARTGYTGEDGFEIFIANPHVVDIWNALMDIGAECGVRPVGLGARDTLRLEAGLPLHGHELSEDRSALEFGYSWVVKFDKGDFIGRETLKNTPTTERKYCFKLLEAGVVRHNAPLYSGEMQVGTVTSGTKTPSLPYAIGLAYVSKGVPAGEPLEAEVRGRRIKIAECEAPFFKTIS